MVVILDLETNGFKNSSVLEFAALKYNIDDLLNKNFTVKEQIHRYYFPNYGEEINPHAAAIHGIKSMKQIRYLRGDNHDDYSMSFNKEFTESNFLNNFFKDVKYIIGHNISYDISFFPENIQLIDNICTMLKTKNIVKSENKYGKLKNPKLKECLKYYNITYENDNLHGALYDTQLTAKLFLKLLENNTIILK